MEILHRFFEEVVYVEVGGPVGEREERLRQMRALPYNDLSADRPTVAAAQALEATLQRHAAGQPGCIVTVNEPMGGLVLRAPGQSEALSSMRIGFRKIY